MRKLAAALALSFALLTPFFALAQLIPDTGLQTTGDTAYGQTAPADLNPGLFIGNYIIKPVLGFTGIIFLILMVYAGVLWMTAAGNEKQIGTAKQILVSAVVGAAIMASAYAITNTVIGALTGVE